MVNKLHVSINIVNRRKSSCYQACQTPLLCVFVDLMVHNAQKHSYHFGLADQ